MQRQPEQHARPVCRRGLDHHRQRAVVVLVLLRAVEIRLVEMQQAQQQQHDHEAHCHPAHDRVQTIAGTDGEDRMWQQMEQGYAQHQAGHQAHGQLGARVRHGEALRQVAAGEGKHHQADAVHGEQNRQFHQRITRLSRWMSSGSPP